MISILHHHSELYFQYVYHMEDIFQGVNFLWMLKSWIIHSKNSWFMPEIKTFKNTNFCGKIFCASLPNPIYGIYHYVLLLSVQVFIQFICLSVL